MTHSFSVEIHTYLSRRIKKAEKDKQRAMESHDEETQQILEGEIFELKNIRKYLTEKIDLDTQTYY